MKTISIAGRLGRDAVTRVAGGSNVTNFTVAVDDGWGEKKTTMWFDCAMWGKRGDSVARFLTKGTQVGLSGDLGKREHDGKTHFTINVNELTLQGGRSDSQDQRRDTGQQRRDAPAAQGGFDDGDAIPFAPEVR